MVIHYIHHSSFLAECENADLLFDYFQGELPKRDSKKPLYVFASHRHPDHFSSAIFELAKHNEMVYYILSDDISKKRVPKELYAQTIFMGSHTIEKIADVSVETLESTDEGVAFLVEADDKVIYHAGDLNDWQWKGEKPGINAGYRARYQKEIELLKGKEIDAAFLPLDPRQEEYFADGFDWFMKQITVKWAFPMHCWDDFTVIGKLKKLKCAQMYCDRIVEKTPFQSE